MLAARPAEPIPIDKDAQCELSTRYHADLAAVRVPALRRNMMKDTNARAPVGPIASLPRYAKFAPAAE